MKTINLMHIESGHRASGENVPKPNVCGEGCPSQYRISECL